jgi:hypothetical protein
MSEADSRAASVLSPKSKSRRDAIPIASKSTYLDEQPLEWSSSVQWLGVAQHLGGPPCQALGSARVRYELASFPETTGINKKKVALARKIAVIMHRMLADGLP